MHTCFAIWLIGGLLVAVPGFAQTELPPPGGWPLRHVRVLRAVPEPPGGLVPYRAGDRWGYADTTGRVWIRPVFRYWDGLPNAFQKGLLRFSARELNGKPPKYMLDFSQTDYYVCNARGERLRSRWRRPSEFVVQPDRSLVAVPRPHANGLLHRYKTEPIRLAVFGSRFGEPQAALPFWASRQISRLRPTGWEAVPYGHRFGQKKVDRYANDGRYALIDQRGQRLTGFVFTELWAAGPNCLLYAPGPADNATTGSDFTAIVKKSGLPSWWNLRIGENLQRYGLLDRTGRRRTEPRYVRLLQIGPNAVWAAAVERDTLLYGLLDTLGRVVLPFAAGPLSLPDSAGLVRRRSAAPFDFRARFSDSVTTRYYRLDGQPAFAERFAEAGAFRQGRALVRRGTAWGFLDLNGHWQPSPIAADRQAWRTNPAQRAAEKATDPLELF